MTDATISDRGWRPSNSEVRQKAGVYTQTLDVQCSHSMTVSLSTRAERVGMQQWFSVQIVSEKQRKVAVVPEQFSIPYLRFHLIWNFEKCVNIAKLIPSATFRV